MSIETFLKRVATHDGHDAAEGYMNDFWNYLDIIQTNGTPQEKAHADFLKSRIERMDEPLKKLREIMIKWEKET